MGVAVSVDVAVGVAVAVELAMDTLVGVAFNTEVGASVGDAVKVAVAVCVGVGGGVAVAGTGVGKGGCVGTSVVVGSRTIGGGADAVEHAEMAIAKTTSMANPSGSLLNITLLLEKRSMPSEIKYFAQKTGGEIIAHLRQVDKGWRENGVNLLLQFA